MSYPHPSRLCAISKIEVDDWYDLSILSTLASQTYTAKFWPFTTQRLVTQIWCQEVRNRGAHTTQCIG
ncbi:hypothetical protein CONPUDRAFT_85933 [Coniophora puteana RWD-64-598 SS2]|uniref:Uncharacterized protein n=1 Tax=Coniophora puteana (strain RWD-64-598) TaxID=741705 RepID=R7SGH9_CONPW|nr:uncharacterized protein CONPUDRAFT_85933 [Coniophora puteana RWD-64-598 SS2]EIW74174.1 hypothetical protein CONPUDRAFT_85933 [Coniophora puteana RWD-64-598 SS2]